MQPIKFATALLLSLAVANAWSQNVQVDLALGGSRAHGSNQGNLHGLVLAGDLGYRFDSGFAVQVYGLGNLDSNNLPFNFGQSVYSLSSFVGVRGLGYLPLNDSWELLGGLGVGRATLSTSAAGNNPDRKETDPILSGGIQWRMNKAFHVGLTIDYLTKADVSMATVFAGWNF